MCRLIENNFRRTSDNTYLAKNRQIWFSFIGGIGLPLWLILFTPMVWDDFRIGSYFGAIIGIIIDVGTASMMLLFIAMGLFTITTEIDLSSRTLRTTESNFRGQKAVYEVSLDTIVINAIRIGVTDATPYGGWIVKAGFFFENENGEECDTAIWSKEVTKIEERNAIMFELYHFFFPNRPAVNEGNIITNGTAVMLLSDSEKEEFSKQEELFEKKKDTDDNSGSSKWDRLL